MAFGARELSNRYGKDRAMAARLSKKDTKAMEEAKAAEEAGDVLDVFSLRLRTIYLNWHISRNINILYHFYLRFYLRFYLILLAQVLKWRKP